MSVVPLPVFLTAYDPTDLPGGSLDPLGFGAGFNALADELLPGLTGVASQPAYLPVLCGTLRLAESELGREIELVPMAKRRRVRVEAAQRLERAWAIGCALSVADMESGEGELAELSSLRGVTYVKKELERIQNDGRREAGTHWALLSRQYTYGMLGIYGGVADRLRLLDKADFSLTPSIGVELGDAFLADTLADGALRKRIAKLAVDETATLPLRELSRWGARARPRLELSEAVAPAVRDGLCSNPRRRLSLALMQSALWPNGLDAQAGEDGADPADMLSEVQVLERCLAVLESSVALHGASDAERNTLAAVLRATLAFENVYRWCIVALERLLYLTRDGTGAVAAIANDETLARAWGKVAEGVPALEQRSDELHPLGLDDTAHRLADVVKFAGGAGRTKSSGEFMDAILARHGDVQHGKLDRGRRKLPWIEREGDTLVISSNLAGGSNTVIAEAEDVLPHAWRTWAARNFIRAVGGVS